MFQASTVVPERFSFEPAAKEMVPEDEDQEIEELFKAAQPSRLHHFLTKLPLLIGQSQHWNISLKCHLR